MVKRPVVDVDVVSSSVGGRGRRGRRRCSPRQPLEKELVGPNGWIVVRRYQYTMLLLLTVTERW